MSTQCTRKTYPTSGNNFLTPRNMIGFMVCWFSLAESNANSESLFMLLLSSILSYYLSSLYKHLFYFQARVEQSVPFHHLSSFSSYYDARVKTSRTDSAAIREQICPAGCPKNTRPACTQGTSRTNPSPSCPRCPGPRPNWDPKPPPLSPGLSAVQGPPNPKTTLTVGPERARSTTREQQVFQAPIPKYVLRIISL